MCWGARNMQTNCIMGNVEMANTISPYKTSKQLLTFVMVTRGDWLWKAANINYKNNGAVVYVGSSLKLHNPLFSFGKLRQNKLMQRFYWSIRSKRWECFWTLCTFRWQKYITKESDRFHNHPALLTMLLCSPTSVSFCLRFAHCKFKSFDSIWVN